MRKKRVKWLRVIAEKAGLSMHELKKVWKNRAKPIKKIVEKRRNKKIIKKLGKQIEELEVLKKAKKISEEVEGWDE